jgi:hypothetical protein
VQKILLQDLECREKLMPQRPTAATFTDLRLCGSKIHTKMKNMDMDMNMTYSTLAYQPNNTKPLAPPTTSCT